MWAPHRFHLTYYLAEQQPPLPYVASSRAVLVDGDDVLVVRGPGGNHVMPGGRLEAGESTEDALRRELLEETGWTIARLQLIGFRHFHHLTPEPPGWTYPYPDFLQVVYACAPGEYRRSEWSQTNTCWGPSLWRSSRPGDWTWTRASRVSWTPRSPHSLPDRPVPLKSRVRPEYAPAPSAVSARI